MRLITFLILTISSQLLSSAEMKGVVSAFVHVKCRGEILETLIVLENNSPYKLTVLENERINSKKVHPNIFSVYDALKLKSYKLGTSNSKGVKIEGEYKNISPVKPQRFTFEPFEKRYWIYPSLKKHFKLNYDTEYLLKASDLVLHIEFEDGDSEYVFVHSNSLIIPTCNN